MITNGVGVERDGHADEDLKPRMELRRHAVSLWNIGGQGAGSENDSGEQPCWELSRRVGDASQPNKDLG